ncbi:hypothetical protein [Planobispora rosea]|uniref:hypothetical protein n=1 Tax=Planobispora rosea TaxID=35762 RepID=UPI00083A8B57|nr:hypothetical protein [Planobispora rosea]
MRLPIQPSRKEAKGADEEPKKIPQRWVVILTAAIMGWWMAESAITGAALQVNGGQVSAIAGGAQTLGFATALGIIGLLQKIME